MGELQWGWGVQRTSLGQTSANIQTIMKVSITFMEVQTISISITFMEVSISIVNIQCQVVMISITFMDFISFVDLLFL